MSTYPFKLRLRRKGDTIYLEELAPSRGGSYFLKESVSLSGKTILAAASEVDALTLVSLRGQVDEISE